MLGVTGRGSAKGPAVFENYRFIRDQHVAFRDLDFFRHVNNAAYVTWTETVRIEYVLEVLGIALDARCSIIMASQKFDYLYPIGLGEKVSVGVRVSRLGTKSLDLEYEIWSHTANTLAVRATNAIVAYDYEAGSAIPIPQDWREKLVAFEPGLSA